MVEPATEPAYMDGKYEEEPAVAQVLEVPPEGLVFREQQKQAVLELSMLKDWARS